MTTENNNSLSIKDYLAIVREKRYMALAAGLVVLSFFVLAAYLWPKSYKADSAVFVQRGALMQPFMKNSGGIEDELSILKNSLTSRTIIDKVLKRLNLDLTTKNAAQYEALIHKVRKNLDVTVKEGRGDNIDLFTVSYENSDPRRARDIVNTLVNEYIEQSLALRRTNAINAYNFLNGQLQSYKEKLDDSDRQVKDFREQHPDMSLQAGSDSAASLAALQSAQVDNEIKLKDLLGRKSSLEMELSGKKSVSSDLSAGPDTPQARLDKLNDQLMVLKTKYTADYPDVIKKEAEIALLKKQMESGKFGPANPLYQQIKGELDRVDHKIENVKFGLAEISKQEQRINQAAGGLPQAQEQWAEIQRNRDGYQKTYDDILQKLAAAKVAMDLQMDGNSSVLKVVDPAVLPGIPAKPNRVKLIMLGLVLGAACGIGAAIGLDFIEKPYRSEESIETELRIPVLISIPRMMADEDRRASRRTDLKVFGAAGAYVLLVLALLAREIVFRYMGIKIGIF